MVGKSEVKLNSGDFHTSIKVKNLRESVKFYHETLGLPIIRQLGKEEDPNIVFLPGVELSAGGKEEDSGTPGFFRHIGIAVENIEEVCERLEAHGIEFETPLKQITFDAIGQKLNLVFFRDPDGIMVELVKWEKM